MENRTGTAIKVKSENNGKEDLERQNKKILGNTSFISTIYNEEGSILEFLDSLKKQTLLPGEIVMVDGGSKDRTFELMESFFNKWAREENSPISSVCADGDVKRSGGGIDVGLIREEGAGISRGRNMAINNASGNLITVSDAGCMLDQSWLEEICSGMDKDPAIINGGMNYSICRGYLQNLLALCIMPGLNETREEAFMPSSRNICFRKHDWEKAGGYPENLDFGEDMRFDFNLKDLGYELRFCPRAAVYWRMREDLSGISRQFFRYAKGDAIGRMYPLRHMIRFLSGIAFLAVLLAGILLSPWIFFVFLPLAAVYSYRPYYRLMIKWEGNESCRPKGIKKFLAIVLIPFLLIYIDSSKVFGYLYGLCKR